MSVMPSVGPMVAKSRLPRLAGEAVQRARLRPVPRGQQQRPRAPFVMLVVLILGAGVAGLLAFNTNMQQRSFAITSLEAKASALASREQKLQLELNELRDPQQVARKAKKLGMVPPPSPAFIRLKDGKVLGQPKPALAPDGMRINPLPARKPRELNPRARVIKVVLTREQARAERKLRIARREARAARQDARRQQAKQDRAGTSDPAQQENTR